MGRWNRIRQWLIEFIRRRTPGWMGTATAEMSTGQRGDRAENAAKWHLQKRGYRIIETNWWAPGRSGELDIIARHGDTLVAVEVKSYPSGDLTPREALGYEKERRLLRLIKQYAKMNRHLDCSLRIDLVVVEWTKNGAVEQIRHIENAVSEN
jgi:putative endonuclease